jgi:hypothetical protein
MSQFMQHDRDKVDLGAWGIAIQTIVPHVGKWARRADGTIEGGTDIIRGRIQVGPRQAIGQGLVIPGVSPRRPGKIPMGGGCASPSKPSARGIAIQRIELRAYADRHATRHESTPEVRGELKGIQPLGAQGGASVPPVRGVRVGRTGIIEPFARAIEIDHGDRRRCMCEAGGTVRCHQESSR